MRGFQNFWSYGMSIRAKTLIVFLRNRRFWGSRFSGPMGGAPGPAATHLLGTTTRTDTATRAAPIANAPRDRIRRAGRFTPLTLICHQSCKQTLGIFLRIAIAKTFAKSRRRDLWNRRHQFLKRLKLVYTKCDV